MKTFNVYNNDNQAVRDAYEMLAANIHINNSQKSLKTIVLTSCNPLEGKTSLAIGLSVAMANSGWKVLLVDADMRKPAAAKRLNKDTKLGLSDYLAKNIELHEVINDTNISRFNYLSCGRDTLNPVGLISSARFEELMEIAPQEYDFVLFDTPALTSVSDGALVASKASASLLVVKMGSTKLPNLKRVKEQLENLNASILGVVLNYVKKKDYKEHLGSYDYFFNSDRFLRKTEVQRNSNQRNPHLRGNLGIQNN